LELGVVSDPKALAAGLARLADEPEAARRMGEEGRRLVCERWTTRHMVARFIRLYKELCQAGGRP